MSTDPARPPRITITGNLTETDIEEILMAVRAVERRDPTKQVAILVEARPGSFPQSGARDLLARLLLDSQRSKPQ